LEPTRRLSCAIMSPGARLNWNVRQMDWTSVTG
jgi:hypothetical protein